MMELQRKLIGDDVRNRAFADALKAVIKPGVSTVLDLGSGTGFLAFLAATYGAKHVTCIESGDIIHVSTKLAARNGIKQCSFIHRHSTAVKTSDVPPVDIIVSETLGNYALEENILESMEDAKRFLKPNGIMIPHGIRQFVCPLSSDRLARKIDIWDTGFGMDFTEARTIAQNNMYVESVRTGDLLSTKDAIRQCDEIDFSKKNQSQRTMKNVLTMQEPSVIHGFALWWEATLVPDIVLSTSPLAKPTHWEQIVLPLEHAVSLSAGESLECVLHSDTRWKVKINLTWTVRHLDASGAVRSTQSMDMRTGYVA